MPDQSEIRIHERVAKVETKVDAIMENHLPHIQKAVDGQNAKLWAIIILLITALVGVIAKSI